MRVLLVDPHGGDSGHGNSVFAGRLERALRGAGHAVLRLAASRTTLSEARRASRAFAPDVIHAVHAFRSGGLAASLAGPGGAPLVVSFRGTDAGAGLEHR